MKDLQKEFNLTYMFISHDLSVVRFLCDRIGVMYLGRMVEIADRQELYDNPMHPYTKALLSAIPVPDVDVKHEPMLLEGDIPSPYNPPKAVCSTQDVNCNGMLQDRSAADAPDRRKSLCSVPFI